MFLIELPKMENAQSGCKEPWKIEIVADWSEISAHILKSLKIEILIYSKFLST